MKWKLIWVHITYYLEFFRMNIQIFDTVFLALSKKMMTGTLLCNNGRTITSSVGDQLVSSQSINVANQLPLASSTTNISTKIIFTTVILISWPQCSTSSGLVSLKNIWQDWDQEKDPETRPVSWSQIFAAVTSQPLINPQK